MKCRAAHVHIVRLFTCLACALLEVCYQLAPPFQHFCPMQLNSKMFARNLFSVPNQCVLVWIWGSVFIILAPFTKVEESFSMQAIYDFLFLSKIPNLSFTHSNNSTLFKSHWDHESFPGVVQRTFFSPFVVHLLVKPFQLLNLFQDVYFYQIISRLSLLTFFIYSYYFLNDAISKSHGLLSSNWMTIFTLSQFHLLFYASRTLPNTFALILVMLVYSAWFRKKWNLLIFLVAFTVLVIRFETILLFACILFIEVFYTRQLCLYQVFSVGIPSGICCLAFTIGFDSFMWSKWTWPEGDGIWFNIIENQSYHWGTKPYLWYIYSVIPRLMMSTLFFALFLKFWTNKYAVAALAFVLIYSFLPHKELRFIIYIVPLLNLCAANVASEKLLWFFSTHSDLNPSYAKSLESNWNLSTALRRRNVAKNKNLPKKDFKEPPKKSIPIYHKIFNWFLQWSFLLNFSLSLFLLFISSNNYPGGEALTVVNKAIKNDFPKLHASQISVYVSNLAAQTGFTRFLQLDQVYYNKEPKFNLNNFLSYNVIYLVLELEEESKYLVENVSSNQVTYRLSANINNNYDCFSYRNITAFDRIDFKQRLINYRTFLNIYKCFNNNTR